MDEGVVKTGVDELLEVLKNSPKLALTEVAKKLKVSSDVVQAWVDFLVEEGIVGIEYKFTTPFIYLNKPLQTKAMEEPKQENYNVEFFKKQFWDRAMRNNIPSDRIPMLWKNHLLQELELKKQFFTFEAQSRKMGKVTELWQEYENILLSS